MDQLQQVTSRRPPHSEDAEKSVLGAVLIDGDVLADVLPVLQVEDFYDPRHQKVYGACRRLFEQGRRVDSVLILDELQRQGDLEKVGGAAYLTQLVDYVPSAAGALDYAQIVSEKAVTRNLIHVCTSIQSAAFESSVPGHELLDWAESEVFRLSRGAAEQETVPINKAIEEAFDEIQKLIDAPGATTGISTGFLDLDEKTAGLNSGDLIIVAGRPSMGKTTFANCVVDHVGVVERRPVAYFSIEVSRKHLVRNMLCSRARVDLARVRRGHLDKDEIGRLTDAAAELMEAPVFIDDSSMASPVQIRAKARRIKQKHGLGLVVVDYIQLMETGRAENRQQEIAQISRQLKAMARELDAPVIAISQLNRGVEGRSREDRRPRMSDLRESGALEQDADLILFLYRESQYSEQADETHAEVIIGKQRNGPTGRVGMRFFGNILRFENETFATDEGY